MQVYLTAIQTMKGHETRNIFFKSSFQEW